MKIDELFGLQKELDEAVAANLGMTEAEFNGAECVEKRIMATKVEVAELANCTAFFKYWKQSHIFKWDETIEEWSDILHFLLSIGNSRNYSGHGLEIEYTGWSKVPLIRLFTYLLKTELETFHEWLNAFEQLICIGTKLGFSEEEMVQAYKAKREINFARIVNKY